MQTQPTVVSNPHLTGRTSSIRSLFTVLQFSERHPAFKIRSLRHLIFNAKQRQTANGLASANGLGVALVRVGRRVLIDENRFFEWLEQNAGQEKQ
jgi:hypothetical protein